MTDSYRSTGGASSPPGASTEFERSIARSAASEQASPPEGLREKIDEDISTVKHAAENVVHKATDKAAEMAERQKSYTADQIEKFATAVEKVGREMQEEGDSTVADYTRRFGASARQLADTVKDKNFGEIAGIAEDFGRRQPFAFLGLAAVAGLAASRFMMASSPGTAGRMVKKSSQPAPFKETYND